MNERTSDFLDAAAPPADGTVVLLLATAANRHWAADTAVELSARWAAGGRRIVLADLHLENPVLHEGLDVENLEGVADIFLYGASLSRIARPVRGGAFYLIPAGTYAPDVGEIYRHARWKKLLAGFRDTNAILALFAPAESIDLEAFARWSPQAIVIGPGLKGAIQAEVERLGIPVAAVLEPPSPTAAPSLEGPAPVEDPDVAPVSASGPARAEPDTVADRAAGGGARDPEGEGAAGLAASGSVPAGAAGEPRRAAAVPVHRPPESELELPPPPVRRRRGRRTASILLWILFFIILLGTAGYLIATIRPDLIERFFAVEVPTVAQTSPEPPAAVEPDRLGELLPYSVQVKAFPSLDAAREELTVEQERLESVPFFISPEEIQGIIYYKILSGLATDTTAAIRLRDRLVQIGAVDEEDAVGAWSLIQFTPLAFHLGEYPTLVDANERADSLIAMQIPTYPAAVDYSDGSQRWSLYAGAFPDSATAMALRRVLTEAGVDAPLSARTGRPAALPE